MQQVSYDQQVYENVPVEKGNPGRILLTLYDAAIRFVEKAKDQIKAGDGEGKEASLVRAYAIITEFLNSLDYEQAPELCANLEGIYGFMLAQITEANDKMDTEPLAPVLCHLADLRQAWAQVVIA